MKAVGMRIKDLRISKSMTMRELGKAIGVSNATISDWENGKVMPSGENLLNLADLLNVSADYLLGRTDRAALESQSYVLKSRYHIDLDQISPLTGKKMTSRERKQYVEVMENAASALFYDDELPERDKELFYESITKAFWEAKRQNQRKPKKKDTEPQS